MKILNSIQYIGCLKQPVKYGSAALSPSSARIWKFPPRIPLLCSSLAGQKQLIVVFSFFFFSPAKEEQSRGILGGNFQTRVHDGNKAAGPYVTGCFDYLSRLAYEIIFRMAGRGDISKTWSVSNTCTWNFANPLITMWNRGSVIAWIWIFLHVQPIFVNEMVLRAMNQNFKAVSWL